MNLKGKERNSPPIPGVIDYFEDYASKCEYELGENENGRKISRIPENSRYIKNEEILYKVQKWSELENVRYFYNFFKSRKNEFEK